MFSGKILPSPTEISVPTMMRTMLYKKPLPVIKKSIVPLDFLSLMSKMVLSKVFAFVWVEQKALKLCVPKKCLDAKTILSKFFTSSSCVFACVLSKSGRLNLL